MTRALPTDITIRPLQPGDSGWIIYRHGSVIAPEFGWNMIFEAEIAQILADFVRNFDPEREQSWIVERTGQILGSLFLIRQSETTAKLRVLYVEAEARGLGLATTLLQTAFSFAREKGYRTVSLFTTNSNVAARRIYTKLGMRLTLETPEHFAGQHQVGEIWEIGLR